MASSSKRSRSQAFADEQLLAIRLAEGEPLAADTHLLRANSSVARGLPADADAWDLSGLLLDGQPVRREAVVAWLNAVHLLVHGEPFEAQQPALGASLTGLAQLLAFADAVGSSKGVLQSCAARLDGLQAHATLGQQQLALETDGRAHYFPANAPLQLVCNTLAGDDDDDDDEDIGQPAASEEEVAAFIRQLARQTEALLHLAYRLQLVRLLERLHAFVRCNAMWKDSLFNGRLELVFSERVLDAALGPNAQVGKDAWASSVLAQPASFVAHCYRRQLLEPLDLSEAAKAPLSFRARLCEDFWGRRKGAEVNVELDLFGAGRLTLNGAPLPVQLLLGVPLKDAAASERMMRAKLGGGQQQQQ